ncbi:SWIM zinc finger family protein [Cyanobium sp. ATX 6E8]|uniref:SWIM zinc finger family protein n=1 Tax=Cyanobium sp. ATX 6E8 TaxID=2823701 RepID=UPI0020CB9EC4|nr:SWIM zinc finger family protein [Cyanobium sp. ATX 6E8]MCP9943033.1 SWIM zinc finger family protein [Cyanobium sp. ATX 6E8]
MLTYIGRYTASQTAVSPATSSVTFGADLSQAPVYLNVEVLPGQAFARLMLALGRVVRMRDTAVAKDHSAYQAWVHGQYLKELDSEMVANARRVLALLDRRKMIEKRRDALQEHLRPYTKAISVYEARMSKAKARRRFWDWLHTHNREAWIVLDPIVSVQPDATFFEAFSLDESTYARVTLPHVATRGEHKPVLGTTNIDFGTGLERELARTRSYRPLHLRVGADAVSLDTGVSSTVEKKIELPESWVRGLVEVQAALSLAPVELQLQASAFADVLARLDAQRERQGPRALVFELQPGQPARVLVEPWGDQYVIGSQPYSGSEARFIKVWGRRRLRVLRELLSLAPELTVRLVDSGLPSFWSIEMEGISLTIGLSGWTAQDWAGRARFSAFTPACGSDKAAIHQAAELLQRQHSLSVEDLAKTLNCSPGEARGLLQGLCLAGMAMFEPGRNLYRWRALFPTLKLNRDETAGLEERMGVQLFRKGAVQVQEDTITAEGRQLVANVETSSPMLRRDVDGRINYAECDCSHFRRNKLRQGPCRHIVALSLAGGL